MNKTAPLKQVIDNNTSDATTSTSSSTPATKRKPQKYCLYHRKLKQFIERAEGGVAETSKYLPRHVSIPSKLTKGEKLSGSMTYNAIQQSSYLLQELVSGKLGATIKSFCKRTAGEVSDH